VISHRIQFVIAALQVQSFRFSNLRYFISQLCKSEQKTVLIVTEASKLIEPACG
jgi:hypothetical protein